MSDQHGPYGSGVLHLPTDLVIDPVTVDRLVRQLEAAPGEVIGIVGPVAELPVGSSTRTHAEWRSLEPFGEASDAEPVAQLVTGAVLLRDGLEATVAADTVTLPAGLVRTDPGAVVHRHRVEPAEDLPAGDEARSPFPWRPVVLFLATGTGPIAPDRLEQVELLVDDLLDVDVEPRLATHGPVAGRRRQRPCAPNAATVAALAPDVIVALDESALAQAPAWCTRRGTVLVDMTRPLPDDEVDRELDEDIELISWQIGRHPTRLRARVRPTIGAAALAQLVNRLAAGPQPAPPVDRAIDHFIDHAAESATPVELGQSIHRPIDPPPIRTITLLRPETATGTGPLLDGLADRMARAGHDVRRSADPAGEATGDRVLVVEPGDDLEQLPDLGPGSRAVAADPVVVDQLRARGVRTQLIPVMTPSARQDALRAAGEAPMASSSGVIGWSLGGDGGTTTTTTDDLVTGALASGLVELLDERPNLEVEIVRLVAADGSLPAPLVDHPQVRLLAGRPDPGEQARWTVHVLTAPDGTLPPSPPLLEAAHCGVPTLLAAGAAGAVGGLADPRLVVHDPTSPDAWSAPLRHLLDGDDRAARSAWARDTADGLERDEATDLVIARLLGWLGRGQAR